MTEPDRAASPAFFSEDSSGLPKNIFAENHEEAAVAQDAATRLELAALMRELGNVFVTKDIPAAVLSASAQDLRQVLQAFEAAPARAHWSEKTALEQGAPSYMQNSGVRGTVWEDGWALPHLDSCVSGAGNPRSIGAEIRLVGDEVLGKVVFDAVFQGAPGRAHGGVVAAVFDEVAGGVVALTQTMAFTGRLTVSYVAPMPLGVEVLFRAHLERREGRKLYVVATAETEEKIVATADALFITISPEQFLPGMFGSSTEKEK